MSLKVENPNNPGEEIEVFTPDEIAAKDTELAALKTEAAAAKAEVDRLNKHTATQADNFKKLNQLTEQELAAKSAKEIEDMKRFEAAEARAAALEEKINNDTKTRAETDKENALTHFHGGDAKLKEILEKNYKMINLEGNDTATIQERARLAAQMYKGSSDRPNPLTAHLNGSAPFIKDKSKTEEFLKSDKAAEALRRMGTDNK